MLEITPQKPMAGTHEPLLLLLFFFFFFFSIFLGLQHGWIFLSSRSLSQWRLSLSHASPSSLSRCAYVCGRKGERKKWGEGVVRDRKKRE
jgi:hypothetical protein